MSRPQKCTVEYFSHDADASNGKTLTILFNHFGHEGLSAWWQLLERISSTRNHVIGIGNPESFEYLSAKMHFRPERLLAILSKMAELEAIDKPLFEAGYIWCQNFVDRQEPIYKSRAQELPKRPETELSGKKTELSGKETELSGKETELSMLSGKKTELSIPETHHFKKGEKPQAQNLPQNLPSNLLESDKTPPLNSIKQKLFIPETELSGKKTELSGKETELSVLISTLRKKETKETILSELPDWLNKKTWDAFLEMRKKKRDIPTEHAVKLLIRELEKLKLTGNDPTEVLNRSIMNGWKGVFPLSKAGGQGGESKRNPKAVLKPWEYTRPEDY